MINSAYNTRTGFLRICHAGKELLHGKKWYLGCEEEFQQLMGFQGRPQWTSCQSVHLQESSQQGCWEWPSQIAQPWDPSCPQSHPSLCAHHCHHQRVGFGLAAVAPGSVPLPPSGPRHELQLLWEFALVLQTCTQAQVEFVAKAWQELYSKVVTPEKSICSHVVLWPVAPCLVLLQVSHRMQLGRPSKVARAFFRCTSLLEHKKHGSPAAMRLTRVKAFERSSSEPVLHQCPETVLSNMLLTLWRE